EYHREYHGERDRELEWQAEPQRQQRGAITAERRERDMGEGELPRIAGEQRPARGEQRVIPGKCADMHPIGTGNRGCGERDEEEQRLEPVRASEGAEHGAIPGAYERAQTDRSGAPGERG